MKSVVCALALLATLCLEAAPVKMKPKKFTRDRELVAQKIAEVKDSYLGSLPDSPIVKIDENGNAIAIWQEDGINTLINASTSIPFDGAWSTPVLLSDPTLDSSNPILAMNSYGDAVAVWTSGYPILGCDALFAATYASDTQTWAPAVMLSTPDEAVFDNFSVDMNESGQTVVSWTSFSISTLDISLFSAAYDPSISSWTTSQAIES